MARTSQMKKNRPTGLDNEAQKEIVEWITGQGSMPKYREIIEWVRWRFETDITATEAYGSVLQRAEKFFASRRLKVGFILDINLLGMLVNTELN